MSLVGTARTNTATDAELVHAARTGDATSLGLLLERYRASLYAAALQILGRRSAAEDAVHETFVVALQRLDDLRDPAAVGGWLHAVARNVCRMELRRRPGELLLAEPELDATERASAPSIEQEIERLALRDWVWAALEELSEPLRLTAMLRYFARVSSYDEIAVLCGVPIGTVRSRLNQARLKLADAMLDAAARAGGDARVITRARTREFVRVNDEMNRRQSHETLLAMCRPDVTVAIQGRMRLRGRDRYARNLEDQLEAGVQMRLTRVIAGRGVTIVEGEFQNRADDPLHCPPETTQVFLDSGGESHTILVHLADRGTESR
jgi:RNA polymerase sigma-70 factor (ECF subfamily)